MSSGPEQGPPPRTEYGISPGHHQGLSAINDICCSCIWVSVIPSSKSGITESSGIKGRLPAGGEWVGLAEMKLNILREPLPFSRTTETSP